MWDQYENKIHCEECGELVFVVATDPTDRIAEQPDPVFKTGIVVDGVTLCLDCAYADDDPEEEPSP